MDVASRKRNDDGAFVLYVELEFTNARAAKELVRAWRECADWCRTRERGLLQDSQYALQRLQAQLLVQQQVAGKAWQHGVPADTEKQMSFHADLLTFANKVETKPLWPSRSSPPHHHM